jgi:hypothetical protein
MNENENNESSAEMRKKIDKKSINHYVLSAAGF